MRKTVFIALLIFIALVAVGCNEDRTGYDMARFDRTYIPALVLTGKKDTGGQAVLSVSRLKQDWAVLKSMHPELFATEASMQRVDSIIESAYMAISTGDNEKAHSELEQIRGIMQQTRKKYNIDYFIDYLNDFHAIMENMSDVLAGKQAADLTEEDIRVLWSWLGRAKTSWQAVKGAKFDPEVFLFTKESAEALRRAMDDQERTLNVLESAIVSRNKKLIYKYAVMVKPGYSKIFSMFGNFDSMDM